MNSAELFIKCLESEGVKYIFGVPGEENLQLLQAIKNSSIEFIVTRHEQAAGFMAATIGRLTGIPGVCLSTLGPGATNLVTSAAYAQLGGMPALFITGQKPIKKSKQGNFQIINTVEMFKPITKSTKQIINGEMIPMMVREAFRLAKVERPGAVHLEFPEDVAEEIVIGTPITNNHTRRPIAEEKAIKQAVELIEKSKHPLVLIGAGANRKRTSQVLTELIEKTGIPFFTTQMGKGVVTEKHPQYLGTAALSENDYIHCAINKADLIINIGHDTIEKPPFIMDVNDKRSVIHINFFPAIVDQIYFPQLEVIGDIANTVFQIGNLINKQKTWDFSYFYKMQKYLNSHFQLITKKERFPYSPQQIVKIIRQNMTKDDIVTLDNGMYKIWFARNYHTLKQNTLLLDNALASMGAGLPSAIAAKIVFPEKKVIAICGDGGFLMNSQELETANRLKLNLTIIILRDNGFGMIKWKQKSMGLDDYALSFGNPDFVSLAKSYGANGYQVEKSGDLEKCLKT
ncbi:MAG: acetolactate synthase large subunit, partial [Patescibacteria group bacterium]